MDGQRSNSIVRPATDKIISQTVSSENAFLAPPIQNQINDEYLNSNRKIFRNGIAKMGSESGTERTIHQSNSKN